MAVALIHRGIGGEAIEVAMALRIPNKDALAARQNDAERFVVPGAKARFPRDKISDRWIHVSSLQLERTAGMGYRHFPARECPMIKLPQAFCLRTHWVTVLRQFGSQTGPPDCR
jgi:hypothetical protein